MSNPYPVLFLSADPSANGQARFEAEYRDIGDALRMAQRRERFKLESRWAVQKRGLRQAISQVEPFVLHLAGHQNEAGILLEGHDGQAHPMPPQALIAILSLVAGHTKWVILSGCSEPKQAKAISEKIDHVIGLSPALTPPQRIEAAVSIYDAIGDGRQDARWVARMGIVGLLGEGAAASGLKLYEGGKEVNLAEDAPAQEDTPPTLNFSTHINHYRVYEVNRSRQHHAFTQIYEGRQQACSFFLLHGEDMQSHNGLVQRFYKHYLEDDLAPATTPLYTVVLPQAHTEAAYRDLTRSRLLTAMRMGKLLRLPDDQEMDAAYQRMTQKQFESVAIEIRVRSAYWKPFTPELFRWFVEEYCQLNNPDPFGPQLYFFLSIIYEKQVDHEIMLDEIRSVLPQLKQCTLLEELHPVTKAQIMDWMDHHISRNAIHKEILWSRYFHENRAQYDMAEVEIRLNTMIEHEPKDA